MEPTSEASVRDPDSAKPKRSFRAAERSQGSPRGLCSGFYPRVLTDPVSFTDAKYFQIYITPWRAAESSRVGTGVVSLATVLMGEIVMYNYPVLECLVAFAIVFSIGYVVADNNARKAIVVPGKGVART